MLQIKQLVMIILNGISKLKKFCKTEKRGNSRQVINCIPEQQKNVYSSEKWSEYGCKSVRDSGFNKNHILIIVLSND